MGWHNADVRFGVRSASPSLPSAQADIPTLPSRSFRIRPTRDRVCYGTIAGVRTDTLSSSTPRAGAAPTTGRVRFRIGSSGAISNSGETRGASGIDEALYSTCSRLRHEHVKSPRPARHRVLCPPLGRTDAGVIPVRDGGHSCSSQPMFQHTAHNGIRPIPVVCWASLLAYPQNCEWRDPASLLDSELGASVVPGAPYSSDTQSGSQRMRLPFVGCHTHIGREATATSP